MPEIGKFVLESGEIRKTPAVALVTLLPRSTKLGSASGESVCA